MRSFATSLLIFSLAGIASATERDGQESAFAQVQRIFAKHCLECHGNDADQREAGLRLDDQQIATTELDSGKFAIVPNSPADSELWVRITATGDERMPPEESGDPLSEAEVETIANWIRGGANWKTHWSLLPINRPPVPKVKDLNWPAQPLDLFALRKMESAGQSPKAAASRRVLIRRIYFDLIGLPPTPQQVRAFEQDQSPQAWPIVVNDLLASPLYAQRWGRHWLDVVRYGDSNGSDENHPYPFAWRYRNYVIESLGSDLSFDQFIREQLAGDLLDNDARKNDAVTATGFLAIGTKILAEKDPVKKQADMVDEQIDTIGKALLGYTIACARCHDHKFDPISTKDYYALAGILHSTALQDRPLETASYALAQADFDRQIAELHEQRAEIEDRLASTPDAVINRQAEKFDRGDVVTLDSGYGEGIGIIGDPGGGQKRFVEWDFAVSDPGQYHVQFRYAALEARPGPLSVNGKVVKQKAVDQTTGGWHPRNQHWFTEGTFQLDAGTNVIHFESEPCMSHIDRIRLIRADAALGDLKKAIDRLTDLDKQQKDLQSQAPQPDKAMAITDGDPHNAKVHLRGSHLSLGNEVARGFPSVAATNQPNTQSRFPISDNQSGRLQLANWISDADNGAGRQLARVMVNRVWQWHFGRGLAPTSNNFGLQGELPTHPRLLDYLTMQLIDDNWSLKSLHRRILLSATYRQGSTDKPNELLVGYPRRRMEAEVLRDTMLMHAGRLDVSSADGLSGVTSQNPSPEDLRSNEQFHRDTPKRSVYLPVVRSNAYRFFTLFDFPNATTSVGRRDITTVPTQALLLMNDPFVMDQAARLAKSVIAQGEPTALAAGPNHTAIQTARPEASAHGSQRTATVDRIYQRLFSRDASSSEQQAAAQFLHEYIAIGTELEAWSAFCQSLMATSEFSYVE